MERMLPGELVFWGAGSQALVLHELISHRPCRLVALLSDTPDEPRFGVPLFAGEQAVADWAKRLRGDLPGFAVAIGAHHGRRRMEKVEFLSGLGLKPATLIHPTATLLSDHVGEACQLLARSILGVEARLGRGVILNTGASVDHECRLGDGVHVGPGARVAGRVEIGSGTFVGVGASICPDLTIAADCIIGAGAVVIRDIEESGTYAGVPAKLSRLVSRGKTQ